MSRLVVSTSVAPSFHAPPPSPSLPLPPLPLCPPLSAGINNSSEKDYMKAFARYCTGCGYRVIIFNHLGARNDEVLTGSRIFTYGEEMCVPLFSLSYVCM